MEAGVRPCRRLAVAACGTSRSNASLHVHPPRGDWKSPARGERLRKGCKPNSVCGLAAGENHLSAQPIPGTRAAFATPGAGRAVVPYLALHPMGFSVPPRLRLERCALTAPFHPCRRWSGGGLSFCGTVRRPAFQRAARVYLRLSRSYAASRPAVFGLSSPGRAGSDPPPFRSRGDGSSVGAAGQGWLPSGWLPSIPALNPNSEIRIPETRKTPEIRRPN